jgi:thioredoxin reductase (NADPH)
MSGTPKTAPEPALSSDQFARLAAYGETHDVTTGDELYSTGDVGYDLILLTSARVEIVRDATSVEPEAVVARSGPGNFLGELNLLTGQMVFLTARVTTPGSVVRIDSSQFRRVMVEQPDIADVLLAAFAIRRENLKAAAGAALEIFGSNDSPAARDIRTYVARLSLPHIWFEAESIAGGAALLERGLAETDLPAAALAGQILRNTTAGELAQVLGLTYQDTQQEVDLVVVGAGPAGLAAAVYGASEGLVTVLLDASAPGGQAARSSRIENYLGFPQGISGEALARKAMIQALKFGAQLFAPCEVVQLKQCQTSLGLQLVDGSEIRTHAVIVATGAEYGRLDVDRWDEFEAAGDIHFAATELDARACASQPVVVVGGANSAGQAAMFLASMGSHVDLVVRASDLGARMSSYLVERALAHPLIDVHTNSEVIGLAGDAHLEQVRLQVEGETRVVDARAIFCFIGATPSTGWLPDTVRRDERGFILTGGALGGEQGSRLPFETSMPGVFVAGDARAGSQKRVAAAVGEGASAVASVHARRTTLDAQPVLVAD